MKSEYYAWVEQNVEGTGYGDCREVTEKMAAAFPELTRVRGHYYCTSWGERAHWWLTTPEGEIVDPTFRQFPSKGNGVYVPWPEGAKEPTGMCMECGEPCYDGKFACSENCEVSLLAFYNNHG